jgi:hypothetical protein
LGQCKANAAYMAIYCPATCGECAQAVATEKVLEAKRAKSAAYAQAAVAKAKVDAAKAKALALAQETAHFMPRVAKDPCTDSNPSCSLWAKMAMCSAKKAYMAANCQRSCGYCAVTVCADEHPECEKWKRNKICYTDPPFLTLHCAKSCNYCSGYLEIINTKNRLNNKLNMTAHADGQSGFSVLPTFGMLQYPEYGCKGKPSPEPPAILGHCWSSKTSTGELKFHKYEGCCQMGQVHLYTFHGNDSCTGMFDVTNFHVQPGKCAKSAAGGSHKYQCGAKSDTCGFFKVMQVAKLALLAPQTTAAPTAAVPTGNDAELLVHKHVRDHAALAANSSVLQSGLNSSSLSMTKLSSATEGAGFVRVNFEDKGCISEGMRLAPTVLGRCTKRLVMGSAFGVQGGNLPRMHVQEHSFMYSGCCQLGNIDKHDWDNAFCLGKPRITPFKFTPGDCKNAGRESSQQIMCAGKSSMCSDKNPKIRRAEALYNLYHKPTLASPTPAPTSKLTVPGAPPPMHGCVDAVPACKFWAMAGNCQRDPSYMQKTCLKSCHLCGLKNATTAPSTAAPALKIVHVVAPPTMPTTAPTRSPTHALCNGTCCDRSQKCAGWAAKGTCTTNNGYMSHHCQMSCGLCPQLSNSYKSQASATKILGRKGCMDRTVECSGWAQAGYCSSKRFMKRHCTFTCRACGDVNVTAPPAPSFLDGQAVCRDDNTYCKEWAQRGGCDSNSKYMYESCKKRCGVYRVPMHRTPITMRHRCSCKLCMEVPTPSPTAPPAPTPTMPPAPAPTHTPTPASTPPPTPLPTPGPTAFPTAEPTRAPTAHPTLPSTACPTRFPTGFPTNSPTSSCRDLSASCPHWAKIGDCKTNVGYMETNCMRSCDVCMVPVAVKPPALQSCVDKNPNCAAWRDAGQCKKMATYMRQFCEKTCFFDRCNA